MVQINFSRREILCKLVFYGPGMSGKTTNLEIIHQKVPEDRRGHLTSIATEQDRTLFFDFMPLDLGTIAGMKTKFLLYTVPGQVYYSSTRRLVLQGADGVLFVADSGADRAQDNAESLRDLETNLRENGLDPKTLPLVIQFNKRDLPNAMPVAELKTKLGLPDGFPVHEAVAFKGEGVMPTLKALAGIVIERLNTEYGAGPKSSPKAGPPSTAALPAPPPPAPPPAPAPVKSPPPHVAAPPRPAPPLVTPTPRPAPPAPRPAPAATPPPAARPAKRGCALLILGAIAFLAASLLLVV